MNARYRSCDLHTSGWVPSRAPAAPSLCGAPLSAWSSELLSALCFAPLLLLATRTCYTTDHRPWTLLPLRAAATSAHRSSLFFSPSRHHLNFRYFCRPEDTWFLFPVGLCPQGGSLSCEVFQKTLFSYRRRLNGDSRRLRPIKPRAEGWWWLC